MGTEPKAAIIVVVVVLLMAGGLSVLAGLMKGGCNERALTGTTWLQAADVLRRGLVCTFVYARSCLRIRIERSTGTAKFIAYLE